MIEAFQRDRAKRRGQPRHPLPPDLVGPPQKKRQPFSPRREFTPRQKEIARDIADGLSYAAIGEKLGITEHTVRAHVAQIALILHEPSELSPRSRILWWMNSSEWGTARPCDGGRENALASSRVKQQHDH
jgi:DNA-binding CsgD family transcriptional regulator